MLEGGAFETVGCALSVPKPDPDPDANPNSEWLEQKRARELAKDYLSHTEQPDEIRSEPEAVRHWKNVGRNLKVVDRSLLDEWVEWSRGFGVSFYICNVLWDAFEPVA